MAPDQPPPDDAPASLDAGHAEDTLSVVKTDAVPEAEPDPGE